jgi:hypothetical protein
MAKLQISGQVLHNDLSPAANATVEIWELDLGPGGSNDKILSRKTDAQGRFSGLSSDWADREGTAWGVPVPDILNLEFRVKLEDGRTHKGPFITTHGTSVPIVVPYPPPKPVQKPNRDLVQVIYLSDGYSGGERALYQFIETSTEGIVAAGLGPRYRKIHVLKGNNATLDKFKSTLQTAANSAGVKAVDVMFNTHGNTNKVYFKDGEKSTATVKSALNGLSTGVRAKFRAVLSTACFGATHLDMWTSVGFSSALGSAGIYADSAVSFAPLVARWASEGTFGETVQVANAADVGNVADNLVKEYYNASGKPAFAGQVDSTRTIGGSDKSRLYSLP